MKTIVRVTRVPHGDAPYEIREQWVGRELPVDHVIDAEECRLHGLAVDDCTCGIVVNFIDALAVMRTVSQEATRWLLDNAPDTDCQLIFLSSEVTAVSGPRMFTPARRQMRQHLGLLEVGVGAHDHPANVCR